MKSTLKHYGIQVDSSMDAVSAGSVSKRDFYSSNADTLAKMKHANIFVDAIVRNPDESWAGLRRILLAQCAFYGREAGDSVSATRYELCLYAYVHNTYVHIFHVAQTL